MGIKGILFASLRPACPGRLWVSREFCSRSCVRLALGGFGYQGVHIRFLWSGLPAEALGIKGFVFAFFRLPWEAVSIQGILFASFRPACPGRIWVSRGSYSLSLIRLFLGGFGYQANLVCFLSSGLPWEALGIKGFFFAFFCPACPGRLWVSRGSDSLSFVWSCPKPCCCHATNPNQNPLNSPATRPGNEYSQHSLIMVLSEYPLAR